MTVSLPRFAVRTAIALGAVCTVGIWPVLAWESTQGLVAWGVAFAVVLVGGILGTVPLTTKFARRSPENVPQAWLIGLGIRMLFVLSACLVVWSTRPFPPHPFLVGAGVAYAIILAIEVTTAARSMRPDAAGAGAGPVTTRPLDMDSHQVGDWAR